MLVQRSVVAAATIQRANFPAAVLAGTPATVTSITIPADSWSTSVIATVGPNVGSPVYVNRVDDPAFAANAVTINFSPPAPFAAEAFVIPAGQANVWHYPRLTVRIEYALVSPVINIAAIGGFGHAVGMPLPTAITPTAQFQGTIGAWQTYDNGAWVDFTGPTFAAATRHAATVTLTAISGFTTDGVEEDFFSVAGATVTNPAGTGGTIAVRVEFTAATGVPIAINSAPIAGIVAPAQGVTRVTTAANAQATAAVAWQVYAPGTGGAAGTWGSAAGTNFAAEAVYHAVITLSPVPGRTLTGIAANFFNVAGIGATNAVDSGTVTTAAFPATAAAPGP